MKHTLISLSILFVIAACGDDEPEPCTVESEPFRFVVVDPSGDNQLNSDNTLMNTRIFYLDGSSEISLELDLNDGSEGIYGVSPVLPLLSVNGTIDAYFLERGEAVDTLSVQVSQEPPGNDCGEYIYGLVTFNGATVAYDTTAEPPVYVLVE